MGLFSRSKPKIKVQTIKKDGFSGWIKCSKCQELIHASELQENWNCCSKCNYHYRLPLQKRIDLLCDTASFKEMFTDIKPTDALSFVDSEPYLQRLKKARVKSKRDEAIIAGEGKIFGKDVAIGILDFSYMGGSMGSVVGERIARLIEFAIDELRSVIIVSASGGARMQESILSLMQMAKTAAALTKLHEKQLPFISVLTNPTTGGVTASFASLGDIILAEPHALIGFAGPRVVEQTIGQKLPEGAQRSEFLLEKGMIDRIVKRQDLKKEIHFFIEFLEKNQRNSVLAEKFPTRLKELIKYSENKQEVSVAK